MQQRLQQKQLMMTLLGLRPLQKLNARSACDMRQNEQGTVQQHKLDADQLAQQQQQQHVRNSCNCTLQLSPQKTPVCWTLELGGSAACKQIALWEALIGDNHNCASTLQ